MESRDIEELLNAVQDAKYFVKGKSVEKKKKKKKENQFEVTTLRVENELQEKFERARKTTARFKRRVTSVETRLIGAEILEEEIQHIIASFFGTNEKTEKKKEEDMRR